MSADDRYRIIVDDESGKRSSPGQSREPRSSPGHSSKLTPSNTRSPSAETDASRREDVEAADESNAATGCSRSGSRLGREHRLVLQPRLSVQLTKMKCVSSSVGACSESSSVLWHWGLFTVTSWTLAADVLSVCIHYARCTLVNILVFPSWLPWCDVRSPHLQDFKVWLGRQEPHCTFGTTRTYGHRHWCSIRARNVWPLTYPFLQKIVPMSLRSCCRDYPCCTLV